MVGLILVGFFWTPYDPGAMDAACRQAAPSLAHLMGTDNFGRDIFSRVLQGSGTTFYIAVCVVAIGCVCGTVIGALTGYFGGWADAVLMRVCDSITAFPSFLLALVIIALLGRSTHNIILALGILFIPSFARIARSEFARCRRLNYVQSARLMGAGPVRIMFRHILPNTLPVLFPTISIGFNNAVLAESSMSYLGLGVQPPAASLGRMLSESQNYLGTMPWYVGFVGLAVVLLILGFSLLGEGLQQRRRRV
ncbi:MAG: ABC transporter permease [Intestinimonas sp.]|jgi:peptide/nickel transport system permease protein|nr:ABC transporter permease [Intestinimonas sp.]